MLTHLTFSIGRYGNVALFFSIAPWILQFFSSFSTFRQVINYYSRFQGYVTHWCHKLTETTNRLIEYKIRVRRCQKTWIPPFYKKSIGDDSERFRGRFFQSISIVCLTQSFVIGHVTPVRSPDVSSAWYCCGCWGPIPETMTLDVAWYIMVYRDI